MSENTEPETVDLSTALEKMNADGHPPTGFHMMLLSPEFGKDEDCPTLQLLKKLGLEYNFADTVKRQVFQLPQDRVIISYEFAWLGGYDGIQSTMEEIDKIIAVQMERMVADGILSQKPQARISFLATMPEEGVKILTSFDFRFLEVLIIDTEPHPLEVKKGEFNYWNTLATIAGIDLNEEAAIALNEFQ